jgi:hypothetical protein
MIDAEAADVTRVTIEIKKRTVRLEEISRYP